MRIIAGEHRGRNIVAPDGLDTRPTTDRVRESIMSSLFSMLGGFEGVRILDAFAGSGAMGLEAMSRGADSCVLNDFAKSSRDAIEKNKSSMGYSDSQVSILSSDVMRFGLPKKGEPYSLVFLDPPYKTAPIDVFELIYAAGEAGILAEDCVVVYEHSVKIADDKPLPSGLRAVEAKKYGKTYVTYIKWTSE